MYPLTMILKLSFLVCLVIQVDCEAARALFSAPFPVETRSRTGSNTPSVTPSGTSSGTLTSTGTLTPSRTSSNTSSISFSPSPTQTLSRTPSFTGTTSITPSHSSTSTLTPSFSVTTSITPSFSGTSSISPSSSGTSSITPSSSRTPSITPSFSGTSSITPSYSGTSSITPSFSGTSSITPSLSGTPSITPSYSGTPSQTPSHTSSHTPSSSATPSPTLPPSTVVLSAMGVGLGGVFTGAVLCQLSLMFLIPLLLTQWRSYGKNGSKPELVSLLAANSTSDVPPSPPPPPSLEDMEAKRLESAIATTRAKIQGLKRDLNGDIMGGSGEEGSAPIAEDPETRALNALWERGELIKVTSLAIAELSSFCDEVLVDALEGVASGGVGGDGSTSARLAAVLQGVFDCAAATALATLASPPQSLPMLLSNEEALNALGTSAVGEWASSSSSGSGGGGAAAVAAALGVAVMPRLADFAKVLIKCTLWAQAVDSNFQWSPLPPTPFPFNPDTHQVFSMDGKVLGVGAFVVALSPGLFPRQPAAEGSEPLTPTQLSELSAKRCKVLVIKAP